jgi:DNA-binding CsgD family transcriptional regulator
MRRKTAKSRAFASPGDGDESTPAAAGSLHQLTMRERDVLLLAAEGLTNPQIAKRLSISVRTVESHRAHLMRKLELRHQTDLVRYAIRRGLLPLDAKR